MPIERRSTETLLQSVFLSSSSVDKLNSHQSEVLTTGLNGRRTFNETLAIENAGISHSEFRLQSSAFG